MPSEFIPKRLLKYNTTKVWNLPPPFVFRQNIHGEFKTNFILPNYTGMGNGMTRGYGTLYSLNNPNFLIEETYEEKIDDYVEEEINEEDELMTFVTIDDVPIMNKRKKHKKRSNNYRRKRKNKSNNASKIKYGKQKNRSQNKIDKDIDDETRFNSEEYHKKQHDL